MDTSNFYPYLLPPLTPHSPDGGGAAVAAVVGAVVGAGVDDTKGWLGSAQHRVKSKPSNPHGLLMA